MKKFLTRLLLFFTVTVIVNIVLNNTLPIAGDERFDSRYQYLQQNIKQYNTLFFGSSRTLRHIIPSAFDSVSRAGNVNTRSYNLGTPANKSLETYTQYERFLNDYKASGNKNISYAFIEIHPLDGVTNKNMTTRKGYYWMSSSNMKFIWSYFKSTIHNSKSRLQMCGNYAFAYLLRQIGFNYIDLTKPDPDRQLNIGFKKDGYISLEDEVKYTNSDDRRKELTDIREKFEVDSNSLNTRRIAVENEFKTADKPQTPPLAHLQKLKQLLEKSSQLGIKLTFVIQPRLGSYTEVLALKAALPQNTVIEIANPLTHTGLWQVKNAYDVGHMKVAGAKMSTVLLAQQFDNIVKVQTP
ncbi:hypothetical protein [Mucilaginibacter terrae]|uniref:Uncharacterized protein n=1 Tax=Mucilaginibacter terrae TaxID=1955052 RepID=A0ABU3GYP0_9SPHI|nr:hypothetical protein [Mucilaginibacter terrae]MDT3404770.1 hypothetical protein [Mucilaginibacter terrae]